MEGNEPMRADEQERNKCGCLRCTTGMALEDIANALAYNMIDVNGGDPVGMGKDVHAFGLLLISEILRIMAGHEGDPLQ
jgi:hypothetical protein